MAIVTGTAARPSDLGGLETRPAEKGLKGGALGLVSSVVVGVASTAPAYSLAATLAFVVAAVGLQAPIVAILAFVPILLVSIGYKELNRADPDCGTTFTWAARAFGPATGWFGGWGIIAADVLVMASLAQVAGQYVFLLFDNQSIGSNAASGWVLLVGIAWIAFMGFICYVGIEVSANFQKVLLGIEVVMLAVLSIVALVKVSNGTAPAGHLAVAGSWLNPFSISGPSAAINGILLMLFIYWGWDTAVAVNEETSDRTRTPGRAAVISTFLLLAIYALVIISVQAFAGLGTTGIGLGNSNNQGDVLSVLGSAIFGSHGFGAVLARLLVLMVLSSAAASTQTTILPTARTTLSMAVYHAIPKAFARVHRRFLTPTVSTAVMSLVSIGLYAVMNYISSGSVISDSVSALGIMIAFYYGLTGFACFWYYRGTLRSSTRNLWMRGILPLLGGTILWAAMGYNFWFYWSPTQSSTTFQIPFWPHWDMGGIFVIEFLTILLGVVLFVACRIAIPRYFRGETLRSDTPTLVPEAAGLPVDVVGPPAEPAPAT